jgi:hypothetical protein
VGDDGEDEKRGFGRSILVALEGVVVEEEECAISYPSKWDYLHW